MGAEERNQLTNARVDVRGIAQRTWVNPRRVATGKVYAVPTRRGLRLQRPAVHDTGCGLSSQSPNHGRLLQRRVTVRAM